MKLAGRCGPMRRGRLLLRIGAASPLAPLLAAFLLLALGSMPAPAQTPTAPDPAVRQQRSAPLEIRGTVTDSAGRPASGVRVSLHRPFTLYEQLVEHWEGTVGGAAESSGVAATRTDPDGRYRLLAPEPGVWKLGIRHRGTLPLASPDIAVDGPAELPEAALIPAVVTQVRVTDASGRPVSGAWLRAVGIGSRGSRLASAFWSRGMLTGRTGPDGAWTLMAAEEKLFFFHVVDPGGELHELSYEERPASDIDLTIPSSSSRKPGVEVRVVDEEGRPAAGALLATVLDGSPSDAWVLPFPQARADAEGRATLPVGALDAGLVTVFTPDGAMGTLSTELPTPEEEGEGARLRIQVVPPSPLVGRVLGTGPGKRPGPEEVVAGKTGSPLPAVPGAWVWSLYEPGRAVRTDAEGAFAVPLLHFGGGAMLQASAPGHIAHRRGMEPEDLAAGSVELVLEAAATAIGVVVDPAGRPVPGAEVRAQARFEDLRERPAGRRMSVWKSSYFPACAARTDNRGRFRLPCLFPSARHEIRAGAEGFGRTAEELGAIAPGLLSPELRLVLPRARPAYGTVLGPGEEPVAGADVMLLEPLQPQNVPKLFERIAQHRLWGGPPPIKQAVTDAAGRFEFPDLPAGTYDLLAQAPGLARGLIPGVEVPEGWEEGAFPLGTLVLDLTVGLEGRVVDSGGRGLSGARVEVSRGGDGLMGHVVEVLLGTGGEEPIWTDADGIFFADGWRRGEELNLSVLAPGYLPREMPGVRVPREQPLEVVLDQAAQLSGRVLDELREPVPGAGLRLVRPEEEAEAEGQRVEIRAWSGDREHWASSGADGSFRFESVPAGDWRLRAAAKNLRDGEVEVADLRVGESRGDVELILSPGETLVGRVTDPSGNPVEGAMLSLGASGSEWNPGIWPGRSMGTEHVFTDGDGGYELGGLEVGPADLQVRHEDYETLERKVEIRPGRVVLDLVLEPTSRLVISGRAVDLEGRPVSGVSIQAYEVGSYRPTRPTQSAEDGSFEVTGVEDGTYRLNVTHERLVSTEPPEVTVTGASVRGVEVLMEPGQAIYGRVLGLELDELSRVQLNAFRADSRPVQGSPRYDGSYRLEGLSPGSWRLHAYTGDGRQTMKEVELAPGVDAEVDLDFNAGFAVTGRVTLEGEPLAGAGVSLSAPDLPSGWASTNFEGVFEISGLEAGTYELGVTGRSRAVQHKQSVSVPTAGSLEIDLQLGGVAGRVVDEEGRPVEGAEVSLVFRQAVPDISVASARTDAAGSFRLDEVGQGSYSLLVERQGYSRERVDVEVGPSGSSEELLVLLERTGGTVLQVLSALGPVTEPVQLLALDAAGEVGFNGAFRPRADGTVELSTLAPGAWRIFGKAGSTATGWVDVNVGSSQAGGPPAVLRLPAPGVLRVRASAGAGQEGRLTLVAPGRGELRLLEGRGSLSDGWTVGEQGVVIRDVPPGTYRLRLTFPDGTVREGEAVVVPGQLSTAILP